MKHLSETKEYKESGLLSQAKMIEDAEFWKTRSKNLEAEKEKILKEALADQGQSQQIASLKELVKNLETTLDSERKENITLRNLLTELGVDVTKTC